MKKITTLQALTIIIIVLFTVSVNAQITKGNWMVGGSGSFSYSNTPSENIKAYNINLTPDVGYFIVDKLAIGTLLNYNYDKSVSKDFAKGESKYFYAGPFVRYYFLEKEEVLNLFLETNYNFSLNNDYKSTSFGTKAAAVYFLNSSVGVEVFLQYLTRQNKYSNNALPNSTSNKIQFGIGFQIHLEK